MIATPEVTVASAHQLISRYKLTTGVSSIKRPASITTDPMWHQASFLNLEEAGPLASFYYTFPEVYLKFWAGRKVAGEFPRNFVEMKWRVQAGIEIEAERERDFDEKGAPQAVVVSGNSLEYNSEKRMRRYHEALQAIQDKHDQR